METYDEFYDESYDLRVKANSMYDEAEILGDNAGTLLLEYMVLHEEVEKLHEEGKHIDADELEVVVKELHNEADKLWEQSCKVDAEAKVLYDKAISLLE